MPDSLDLRVETVGDRVVVTGNRALLFAYERSDVGMAHVAVSVLRSLGVPGQAVAAAFGLTESYVATLYQRAIRQGSAGLVRASGRPSKLAEWQLADAVAWHDQGVSNVEIGRRLGVHNSTISRALADRRKRAAAEPEWHETELDLTGPAPSEAAGSPAGEPDTAVVPTASEAGPDTAEESTVDAPVVGVGQRGAGTARIRTGSLTTRYAGATLLYPFWSLVDAETVLAAAAVGAARTDRAELRFDDLAVLTGTCVAFGLGFASLEQAKHPDRSQVGPVAGIDVLPELRTLRPRLAAIADACDPLGLQRSLASAMLRVEPNLSGVYFVDEHFMPYSGAKPVGSGWNTKRRHAEPGRVDTTICDPKGRAVCFTSGEPSGLAKSLPATLDQLREILGPDAPILLGFDRGGAYPAAFRACRKRGAHWITYRRAPLVAPTRLPIQITITHPRRTPVTVAYAEETVTINKYGQARQITLFEDGRPVLQIITSDTTTCPAALILFMRARWRIENLFKYLDFYGIDYLADYHATIEANTRKVDNPERKRLKAELKNLTTERDRLRERIGALHTDQAITITELNRQSQTAQRRIRTLDKQIDELKQRLKTVPAKLPANQINPDAVRAIHRAHRRALQMVLRLLAANAENWLAHHLNAYLQDNDEYRATARNLLHLGGTITYTGTTITVELDQPNTPRLTHALALLLDEINQTPPRIPGDPRPLTYTLKA
jgi:Transposase protein